MSQAVQSPTEEAPESQPPLVEPMSDDQAETFYMATLGTLFDDAWTHGRLKMLADAATRTLAQTAVACGPGTTGDILMRLGGHIMDLSRQREAQREADESRKKGRAPH